MFRDELARVIALLQANPELGVCVRGRDVRRLLLPDTEQFVFYRVRTRVKRIEVVALWGAARGSGPPLPR
jgi:plasmid stabilization system protein ParE